MAKVLKIQHFILMFDRTQHRHVATISFGTNLASAITRYEALEAEFRDSPHMDIVLVGSDSIDTVKITHANYFDGFELDLLLELLRLA